jgi:hypothetical protein
MEEPNDNLILHRLTDNEGSIQSDEIIASPVKKLDEWIESETIIKTISEDGKTLKLEVENGNGFCDCEDTGAIFKSIFTQTVSDGSLEMLSFVILPFQIATMDLNLLLNVPNGEFGFEVKSNAHNIQKPYYAEDWAFPNELTISARYRYITSEILVIINFTIS